MYIKAEYSPEEDKLLANFEEKILADTNLTDREKIQCWVWLNASIMENRLTADELRLLEAHINKNPHFFKDLIWHLTEIHHLIKSENQAELIRRLKESIEMIDALKKLT